MRRQYRVLASVKQWDKPSGLTSRKRPSLTCSITISAYESSWVQLFYSRSHGSHVKGGQSIVLLRSLGHLVAIFNLMHFPLHSVQSADDTDFSDSIIRGTSA